MIKIKLFVCSLLLLAIQYVKAQQELVVEGVSPDLHLTHTVVAKENWYSVGRLYNVSAKQLAAANKTTLSNPLSVGQTLKIPLGAGNFSQNGQKTVGEALVPLYHTVQEKEWMYRISVNHNKVPIDMLQKWNNITNGQLHAGMKLIVGYLKVRRDQSALASQAGTGAVVAAGNSAGTTEAKKEPASSAHTALLGQPDVKKEGTAVAIDAKKDSPARTNTPVLADAKKETPPPVSAPQHESAPQPEIRTVSNASRNGGYFHSLYSSSGKGTAGNAGIFRSTSGWNDGKYYALMNNVPAGTIIKIFFQSTNKSAYAKVLGPLPEMKESVGLALRISDAAASELGVSSGKFYVDVNY